MQPRSFGSCPCTGPERFHIVIGQPPSSGTVEPMSTYRLKNLLLPRSVALVGASSRQGSVGRAILGNIRKANFQGNSAW